MQIRMRMKQVRINLKSGTPWEKPVMHKYFANRINIKNLLSERGNSFFLVPIVGLRCHSSHFLCSKIVSVELKANNRGSKFMFSLFSPN